MNLKTLTNILKSGNMALGQKLNNLLTEDCNILEYTDDAVLFQKNNYLVLAKFKHNLTEHKMTSDAVLDNEIIYVSAKKTEKGLRESLVKLVDNIVEGDYVSAEEDFFAFCEEFFQFNVIKSRFPEVFTENLVKKSSGFKLRKMGFEKIAEFKSEVFSLAALRESAGLSVTDYASIIEECGAVLFLGKEKVYDIVKDAVLGNSTMAKIITENLFESAKTLVEANEDIRGATDKGYKIDDGKFEHEDDEEVESEDFDAPDEVEDEFPVEEEDEEGRKEFEEFDPSKLGDDEVKELHKVVLTSILSGMEEFVSREANNPDNAMVSAELDDKLKNDVSALNNSEISDEELSQIEARWSPVISYFLDSDLYTPEQDIGAEEVELRDDETGEEPDFADEPEEEGEQSGEEEQLNGGMGGNESPKPKRSIPSYQEDEERNEPTFK